jgi:hypothetical protein
MTTTIEDINGNYQNIAFSKQKTKQTNKFLYVYNDKKPLLLKLPQLELAFGLQKNTFYDKAQYNFDLSFKNNAKLLEEFEKFDNFIIGKVKDSHFPDTDLAGVRELYTSCIKYPQNPQFSPTLKTKIITHESKIKCDFFDSEVDDSGKLPKIDIEAKGGDVYALALLPKQKKVDVVLECIGLWFMNGKFGLSFKALQVKVYPAERKTCDFLEDSDNSDVDFLGE